MRFIILAAIVLPSTLAFGALQPALQPLADASRAGALSMTQSTATVADQLRKCLDSVAVGGTPDRNACTAASQNSFGTLLNFFNLALEQFVGIVPTNTYTAVYDAGFAVFKGYGNNVPGSAKVISDINLSLVSVIAKASGTTPTIVQLFQNCFAKTLTTQNQSPKCFTAPSGPFIATTSIANNILDQFVGTLPVNTVNNILNIYAFYFSLPVGTPLAFLQAQVGESIRSVTASTFGEGATLGNQLTGGALAVCVSNAIMDNSAACVTPTVLNGPLNIANGAMQQFFGIVPVVTVLALQATITPLFVDSPAPAAEAISQAVNLAFTLSAAGPYSVTCIQSIEDCVESAIAGGNTCVANAAKCTPLSL